MRRACDLVDPDDTDGAIGDFGDFERVFEDAEPAKLLRLAAEAEWKGDPPDVVVDWLADRDIKL